MALAKPVKTARGPKSDAFVLRLQGVATGAAAWGNPVTFGRVEIRIETLEAKVYQLLAQSGIPITGSMAEMTPSSSAHAKDVIDQGLLSIGAANMLLNEFRATLMPHCPFVIISAQTTAETLRRDKPFLLLTILTAALHDNMPLQRKLEKQVKKVISDCMIFDSPVSFEILQGLLVHLACITLDRVGFPNIYILESVSSLIYNSTVPLNVDSGKLEWILIVNWTDSPSPGDGKKKELLSDFFISHLRKYLQIFRQRMFELTSLVSSRISQILQKGCSFPYLPYFESICKLLAADAEYPSDKYLLHVVQLQQLSEKITLVSSQHVPEIHNTPFSLEHYYRELKSELDLYRANLPFLLCENQTLFMQFYTVAMYLCQVTLFDHKPGAQPPHHELSFRIEALRMGLSAAKTLLHFYMCLPLGDDAKFNNVGWVQLGFAVTLACKLVVAASEPSIHPHTVDLCCALDISNTIKQCIIRIQALITSDMDESGDRDVFFHYEKRLKRVQWWFESRIISGPSTAHSYHDAQLTEGIDSSTGDASHCVGALQPTLNGLDNHFQWLDFFPDTAVDEMYVDWMAHPTTSFDQHRLG
ncbi:hypothetical protein PENSOL_c003G10580 [Penicillium solitum]|uniref:Transcription factor domain-containing protein n=1 Tax=Penicillium solitum TaxID=60172 RepID=A0A1V6RKE2_9EURO|nr:uncharacterized protein PENSOL_c003G10580 [Penicillium solitum]OQE01924.1 hypothetical protein PENSOL_c003G10580 [Penicillium solitum]